MGRIVIGYDEAVGLLPDGDTVHCFMNPSASVMVGADWARVDVLKALADAKEIHVTGENAQSMGHGLAVILERTGDWAFFEAKRHEPTPAAP